MEHLVIDDGSRKYGSNKCRKCSLCVDVIRSIRVRKLWKDVNEQKCICVKKERKKRRKRDINKNSECDIV